MTEILSRCTRFPPFTPTTRDVGNIGPMEGDGFVLLTNQQVTDFTAGPGAKLIHRGRASFGHICADKGNWGFRPRPEDRPVSVTFLHYDPPQKLNKFFGAADGNVSKEFSYTGAEFLRRYQAVQLAGYEAHVWRRDAQGEVAFDFCMFQDQHGGSGCVIL